MAFGLTQLQLGIPPSCRVGDRIHAVNGVSIAGLTREEAFEVLLSLGEQHIGLAVENCPEE